MNNAQLSEMSKKKLTSKRGQWQVLLHDDNRITFDHVIDCLMEVCNHSYIQAVQCATITHRVGYCSIYVDNYDYCLEVSEYLCERGLTFTVTKYKKQ